MKPGLSVSALTILAVAGIRPLAAESAEPFRPAAPTGSPRIERLVQDLEARGDTAAAEFWQEIEATSAPIVEPIADEPDASYVTFVWRGAPGTRNVAIIDGVAVGVGDDDPARSLMTQLAGTDIWYRTYVVRNDARFRYWLSPNDSLESLRNIERNASPVPDPLNPRRSPLGLSFVELAGAPVSPHTIERSGIDKGNVDDLSFHSEILGNDRRVSVYTPPRLTATATAGDLPLLIVFDRSSYLLSIPVPTILDNMIDAGLIPPVVAILLGSPDRNLELGASADFTRFVADELVPWARTRYGATGDAARTIVAGSSRGGLAATYAAYERADVFGNVLAQSPSLWFSPDGPEDQGWLPTLFAASAKLPIRFYLENGTMEASIQRVPIQRMRDVLRSQGYELRYHEFNGAHDYQSWRHTFAGGLEYLLTGR